MDAQFINHAMGLCTNGARIGVEHAGVEVALQDFGSAWGVVGEVPGPSAVGLPVQAERGALQGGEVAEEVAAPFGKHRHRHTVLKPFEQILHVGQDALDIQVTAQGTGPAVKELDEVNAGVDLGMQVGLGGGGDGGEKGIRQLRLFPQHPARKGPVLAPLPSTM